MAYDTSVQRWDEGRDDLCGAVCLIDDDVPGPKIPQIAPGKAEGVGLGAGGLGKRRPLESDRAGAPFEKAGCAGVEGGAVQDRDDRGVARRVHGAGFTETVHAAHPSGALAPGVVSEIGRAQPHLDLLGCAPLAHGARDHGVAADPGDEASFLVATTIGAIGNRRGVSCFAGWHVIFYTNRKK